MANDGREDDREAEARVLVPVEVLVVDDDPAILEAIVEVLSLGGCLTLEARSGRAALDLLRSRPHRPAVILLDLIMPDGDGWHFRKEQLGDPALSAIPVILMSASRAAPGFSAQAHIPKPFSGRELLHAVARVAEVPLG